jgi:hypothetical protein
MRVLLLAALATIAACGGIQAPLGAMDMTEPSDGGDLSVKPFGAPCMMNSECASNVCFIGNNRTFCSLHCAAATQATDCPNPPTSGVCNMQGYCKP